MQRICFQTHLTVNTQIKKDENETIFQGGDVWIFSLLNLGPGSFVRLNKKTTFATSSFDEQTTVITNSVTYLIFWGYEIFYMIYP